MRLVGLGSSEADQVLIEIEQYAPDSLRKTIATKNVRKMTNVPRGLATEFVISGAFEGGGQDRTSGTSVQHTTNR